MIDREKKILKNSIIFTIGNLGSKVFSYVMVLVYTYFINSAELGYYDIILTTISLLQPIVLLSFDEGIYRWLIDAKDNDINKIVSTCIKTIFFSTTLTVIIFGILNIRFQLQYALDIVFLFISSLIYQLILSAVRGISNSKLYALSGILNSFFLLIFEVVGIIIFNMGVEALLLSKIFANLLTIAIIYIQEPKFHKVFMSPFNFKLSKEIMVYTLPLIPNSISWWIVNSSDRYIILFFLGTSFNGIYTISNKFPTIITTIAGILYFALQEAIIKEYKSADRDAFYSRIFEKYYVFLFSLVLCGIPITKLVITYFVGDEYKTAWKFMGFLFLSTVFGALSSFLGIGYQIAKDTVRSAYSTILSAVINVMVNIFLIKYIGLHAASFSTLFSYIFLFGLRIVHSKKYFNINIRWANFLSIILLCIISIIISYLGGLLGLIVMFIIGLSFTIISNKYMINEIINRFLVKHFKNR